MTNELLYEYDHQTGEEIVREMTKQEQEKRDADVALYFEEIETKKQKEIDAKIKKDALLKKLGISEEEAELLAKTFDA